ncbi:MAG: hypothetical protein FJY98_02710 [Candidatus Liptonbacteria bacterium]|nr:hypothetical protein [Candidatus Liptonbacteria bacterium]
MNNQIKSCQNCKKDFVIAPEDFQFYERIKVPAPTFCPDCRLQRRMAFRNERSLYKNICALCKKQFVSMYSPDKPFIVYCKECWYSDNWDPLQYGQDYDWDKPFFEQFRELMLKVPRIGIMHIRNNINADYANYISASKNIYLSQSVIEGSENIYYSRSIDRSKEIFDCFNVKDSERCYENVDGGRNYRSKFLVRSRDCIDSAFLFDCVNCQNCIMSANLRNRQYVIRGKQYSKEEYATALEKIEFGKQSEIEKLKQEFENVMEKALHKFANITKSVTSTGDNIDNSKNAAYLFDAYNCENVRYAARAIGCKDSYDIMGGANLELVYEQMAGGYGSRNSLALSHGEVTLESNYTDWCQSSSNLFGCISLRKKQYCILNKQYSEKEYKEFYPKIIEHMNTMPFEDRMGRMYRYGEFFPIEISPFAYNETIAEEYFLLAKEEIMKKGYTWRELDPLPYVPTVKGKDLPDDIANVENSATKELIECENCKRVYRIVQPELEFLRREQIPLPRTCQECRHAKRLTLRNPLKLWSRKCMCDYKVWKNTAKHVHHPEDRCSNEFETSYSPERPEVIYCEQCYQAEIS